MERRVFLKYGVYSAGALAAVPLLNACGGGSSEQVTPGNRYVQANLAASSASYNALFTFPEMIDAWGGAIRPAGAGGHFWITAGANSYEFIGDVNGEPLTQDPALKIVSLPASGDNAGSANGVVFNSTGTGFQVTQTLADGSAFTAPAKFVFVSDNGVMSAWAQHSNPDGTLSPVVRPGNVVE